MTEGLRSGALLGARRNPHLLWLGGFLSLVLVAGAFALLASSQQRLPGGATSPAFAAGRLNEGSPALLNRTSCAEIGNSDLRSPSEGLWFQSNCFPIPELPLIANTTNCNRTSLDPAVFAEVAEGLFVFRQTPGARASLWYASSKACFDLVSARVVTAVCADQTVSFSWSTGACADHGGVLIWVNGR